MAKNTRESVIPDEVEGYVLTEEDKKTLALGGSVLYPFREDFVLPDGDILQFELLVLYNPDTDMYEFHIGTIWEGAR